MPYIDYTIPANSQEWLDEFALPELRTIAARGIPATCDDGTPYTAEDWFWDHFIGDYPFTENVCHDLLLANHRPLLDAVAVKIGMPDLVSRLAQEVAEPEAKEDIPPCSHCDEIAPIRGQAVATCPIHGWEVPRG